MWAPSEARINQRVKIPSKKRLATNLEQTFTFSEVTN